MLSPVRGLRPWRAGRLLVEKVPNPAMVTVSSLARASLMAENTAFTAPSAVALDKPAWPATWEEISDFFIRFHLYFAAVDGRSSGQRERTSEPYRRARAAK